MLEKVFNLQLLCPLQVRKPICSISTTLQYGGQVYRYKFKSVGLRTHDLAFGWDVIPFALMNTTLQSNTKSSATLPPIPDLDESCCASRVCSRPVPTVLTAGRDRLNEFAQPQSLPFQTDVIDSLQWAQVLQYLLQRLKGTNTPCIPHQ